MRLAPSILAVALPLGLGAAACDGPPATTRDPGEDPCGPTRATVARVIDGDTVELTTGERVRYLMIDTPESTQGQLDCYGQESKVLNEELVDGAEITLQYDARCIDTYGRLLAYVHTDAGEVNRILIRQGYACFYSIPPNGYERIDEFRALEREASVLHSGLWGACSVVTCQH